MAGVSIGNRVVGDGYPAFIVAEIGANHNGDLDTALRLIDAAAFAGVDAVKFQKRDPDHAIPEAQKSVMRETPWGEMTYLDYRKRLEFGIREYSIIDEYCRHKGILWFASPWDVPSVGFLCQFNPPAMKIASASLTDNSLLDALAFTGRPLILSTGMSTMEEVRGAVSRLNENDLILCHCNSTYPCPPADLNLLCIQWLQREFPGVPVGYSGHEVGLPTTVATIALGAKYIERHITLDRSMWGTDQASSVEPMGFHRLVQHIRTVESAMGDGVKRVTDGELPIRDKLRKVNAS